MPLFKKLTILGVGLLGGSLGLAAREKKLAGRVIGYFRHPAKIAAAKKCGSIDEGTTDLRDAVQESDCVILCTPVCDIMDKLAALKRIASPELLITDVGSTKASVMRAASKLNFIGSHPIAGSEAGGLRAARADLFAGSVCVLTP